VSRFFPTYFQRYLSLARLQLSRRFDRLPATVRGMVWMAIGGITFSILNTLARVFSMQMDPFEAQFLR
jgi:hypothetical protein